MHNVPYTCDDEQLRTVIAKIVHRPPIQPPGVPKVNFHIELFGFRRGRKNLHKGFGLLTFSSREVALHFLANHPSVFISSRPVRFTESTKDLNDARVRNVRDTSWRDPLEIQQEMERVRERSSEIDLVEFSFGRRTTLDDRRESFSREAIFHGAVSCDLNGRRLTVRLVPKALFDLVRSLSLDDAPPDPPSISFHYLASRVMSVQYNETHAHHCVLIETELPPTFLSSTPMKDQEGLTVTRKQRLSSPAPQEPLPPVLKTLCLTFSTSADRQAFLLRSRYLHLPRATPIELVIDDKDFYSSIRFDSLRESLSKLPFRLAFEIDKQVHSGLLSPVDVEDILPTLTNVSELYPTFADALFRFFINELQSGELRMAVHMAFQMESQPSRLGQDPRPEPKSARARKRRRQRDKRRKEKEARRLAEEAAAAKPTTLIEAFELSLQHYERVHGSLRQLEYVAFAPGIYQSYHVVLTPTNLVLEG